MDSMFNALREGLREEMASDERVILLGEETRITRNGEPGVERLRKEFGAQRVWGMSLEDAGIVGIGIGAALGGLRPVIETQMAGILVAALEQLIQDAAQVRYRSRGQWNCPIVIRIPTTSDPHDIDEQAHVESLLLHMPGLRVVVPSTSADARAMMRFSIRDEDPVIFIDPLHILDTYGDHSLSNEQPFSLDRAIIRRVGNDASVITYGTLVIESLVAAELVSSVDGIEVEVIDMRSLHPIDYATVISSVSKTNRAIVFHEQSRFQGITSRVATFLNRELSASSETPVARVQGITPSLPDVYKPPQMLPNVQTIAAAIRATIA